MKYGLVSANPYLDFFLSLLLILFSIFALWILSKRIGLSFFPPTLILLTYWAVGIFSYYFFGPYFLSEDGRWYESQAQLVVNWITDPSETLELGKWKEFWPFIIGLFYFVFGRVPLLIISLSAVFVAITSVFISFTAELIWGKTSKWAVFLLFIFSPILISFGPNLGREAIFWLATSLVIYGCVLIVKQKMVMGVAYFFAGALLCLLVRPTLGIVIIYSTIVPAVMISGFFVVKVISARFFSTLAILFGILLTLPIAMQIISPASTNVPDARIKLSNQAESGFLSPEDISGIRNKDDSTNDSGILNSLADGISYFPQTIAGPFIWEMRVDYLWGYLLMSNLYWLFVLLLALGSLFFKIARYPAFFAIASTLAILFVLASTLTNYGIVMRFRAIPILILMPLAIGVLDQVRSLFLSQKGTSKDQSTSRKTKKIVTKND